MMVERSTTSRATSCTEEKGHGQLLGPQPGGTPAPVAAKEGRGDSPHAAGSRGWGEGSWPGKALDVSATAGRRGTTRTPGQKAADPATAPMYHWRSPPQASKEPLPSLPAKSQHRLACGAAVPSMPAAWRPAPHQGQVAMWALLLHRRVLRQVDQVGADGLRVRLHVDGLKRQGVSSPAQSLPCSVPARGMPTCCSARAVVVLTLSNRGSRGRSRSSHW